jgi:hypothetical protein
MNGSWSSMSSTDMSGASRKPSPVVIGKRNDEAIRLSAISGLLHSVRNDGTGLSKNGSWSSNSSTDMSGSQKPSPVVIVRRNDEAIRLLSAISGLLYSVCNNESGLLRHPLFVEELLSNCRNCLSKNFSSYIHSFYPFIFNKNLITPIRN